VDRQRNIARPVAVWVRHDGLALLYAVPQPAAPLRHRFKDHHRTYDTESVVVGRSCTQLCSRVWCCPFMVRPAWFVDRTVCNRLDTGRIPHAVSRPRIQVEADRSTDVKSGIVAVLCIASAIRSSGQTVPVVVTWEYRGRTEPFVVHITNNSGKDIVGFVIGDRRKLPDGTVDKSNYGANMSDMMLVEAYAQLSKDPAAYERQHAAINSGVFTAGTTRDITMGNNGPDVVITADVVFYADGTFDQQNEDQFKQMLGRRQSQLLAMKRVNEIVRAALTDTANDHPTEAAITELAKAAAEAMAHNPVGQYDTESGQVEFLRAGIANMRLVQRSAAHNIGAPSEKDKSERERLLQFVEKQEKLAELITPQCHLEISLKQ